MSMVSTNRTVRLLIGGAVLIALTLTSGCVFVNARFSLDPDGTQHARLEAGILEALARQGEGDFSAEIDNSLAEGRWRELPEETRGQWLVKSLVGEAPPGEALFTEEAEEVPEFGMVSRLLSTEYTFTMSAPKVAPKTEITPVEPPEGTQDDGEAQVQIEGMDEAMTSMMAMMMSSGEAGLRFSVELPGEIVATNGEAVGPGQAAWRIDLTETEPQLEVLQATSRLLNWPNIGRLGGELVARGREELVPALIAAVRRGVLPDPITDDPASATFDVAMYEQLLDIMIALDQAVGEQVANEVMTTLGLNAADLDAEAVGKIAERLQGRDLPAEIDQHVAEWLVQQLGGG